MSDTEVSKLLGKGVITLGLLLTNDTCIADTDECIDYAVVWGPDSRSTLLYSRRIGRGSTDGTTFQVTWSHWSCPLGQCLCYLETCSESRWPVSLKIVSRWMPTCHLHCSAFQRCYFLPCPYLQVYPIVFISDWEWLDREWVGVAAGEAIISHFPQLSRRVDVSS